MTNQEIIAIHPVPWRHMANVGMPGNIVMMDAAGQQVQLFTLIEFAQNATVDLLHSMAKPGPTPESAAQPSAV